MTVSKGHPQKCFFRVGNYETVPGKCAELLSTPKLVTVMQKMMIIDESLGLGARGALCLDMFGQSRICPDQCSHTQLQCDAPKIVDFYSPRCST